MIFRSAVATSCWLALCIGGGCRPEQGRQEQGQAELQEQAAVRQESPNQFNAMADTKARNQPPENATTRFRFDNAAEKLKIRFAYHNGEENGNCAILEYIGGGVAIFDYDRDSWPDLLLAGGGSIDKQQNICGAEFGLFRNHGAEFDASTETARFSPPSRFSHAIAVSDMDNDGFEDVVVSGYDGISLILNQGDGTFQYVHNTALDAVRGTVTALATGDFNRDSIPDLYVARYVDWSLENHRTCTASNGHREWCPPKEFKGTADFLFYGSGDGSFQDVTQSVGLRPDGKGLGAICVDVDNDGDLDIYVANDTTENFLYRNDGQGKFEEIGTRSGVALDERALPNGSMGLTACDVNNDLQVDLWVANYERETFAIYRNEGNANFIHASRRYGIAALGGLYVGFGTDWEDFDRDGTEEIVVANGHVLKYPTEIPRRQSPLLMAKRADRYLVEQFELESYFAGQYEGRGLSVGDLNRDGMQDIAISHINESAAVLLNRTPPAGDYISIRLVGTVSDRDAIGARAVLETSAGKQLRCIVGGGSYLSHNDRSAYFGVPAGLKSATLSITWPSGIHQELEVPTNCETCVVERR